MRKNLFMMMVVMGSLVGCAAAQDTVRLPAPGKDAPMTLMQSLAQRHSVREYTTQPVSDQQLSDLLWAACGINRPEKEMITAPSAMNMQDIHIYVCRSDGGWLWDAKTNTLTKKTDEDLRSLMAGPQKGVADAPLFLLVTSDSGQFAKIDRTFSDLDAGYVSENICLAATALGLATVPRGARDIDTLSRKLSMPEGYVSIVNHPIGYEKK